MYQSCKERNCCANRRSFNGMYASPAAQQRSDIHISYIINTHDPLSQPKSLNADTGDHLLLLCLLLRSWLRGSLGRLLLDKKLLHNLLLFEQKRANNPAYSKT